MANERTYAQLDENSIVTNVFVVRGSTSSLPNTVDVTGKIVGIGWVTTDGGSTFSPPATPSIDLETYRIQALEFVSSFKEEKIRQMMTTNGSSPTTLMANYIRMTACYDYDSGNATADDTAFVTNATSYDPGLTPQSYAASKAAKYSEFISKLGHLFGIADYAADSIKVAASKNQIDNILNAAKAAWQALP